MPAEQAQGLQSRPKSNPVRRRLRWIGLGVLASLGLGVVFTGGALWRLSEQLEASGIDVYDSTGTPYQVPTRKEISGPLNVLLIGNDTRSGQGEGFGDSEAELADVIILLHISEDRSNAVALSFPRDLMIPVPACPNPSGGEPLPAREYAQINSTLNTGGPACTLLAVQALTGLGIPHLAMIDFKGVIEITNVIGGVEVCVARPINDRYSKLRLDAGWHTLKGEDALAFLRTRSSIGDGSDLSRISNQQAFLASLVRTLKVQNAITNPVRLFQLANAAADNMTLSRGLTDLNVITQIAQQVNKVDLDKITFLQLPVYDLEGRYEGRLGLDEEGARFLFDKLIADEPLILAEANPGSGAVVIKPSPTASPQPTDEASPQPTVTASPESTTASSGSAPASSSSPTPEADSTTETQVDPTPEPTVEPLPDWVRGTTGSTTSCTK